MKKWKKYDAQRYSNIRDGEIVLKKQMALLEKKG